ncbi:hypothetical protein HispidOSU_028815, partial [Sigmodon hispidus]
ILVSLHAGYDHPCYHKRVKPFLRDGNVKIAAFIPLFNSAYLKQHGRKDDKYVYVR